MAGLLERLDRVAERPGGAAGANAPDPMAAALRMVQERVLSSCPELVLSARGDQQKKSRLQSVILQVIVREGIFVAGMTRESLAEALLQEIAGFGPIDPLIADDGVSEVMVNGPAQVYVERCGVLELTGVTFRNDEHVMEVISRIVGPLGRRIDTACPYVDARLPDGSRVNAIVPPLALNGPVLTVRKFPGVSLSIDDLVSLGTLSEEMAAFLKACVAARFNVVVSGGTGSGKTTTLNALCSAASSRDRVITIEDAAELRIDLPHLVALEARPANIEGRGSVTIRDLLRNALRMRPDRIVIGEVRGAEAYDLLQALNTGHQGCMSTVHANGVVDALRRLENMALMSGEAVPHEVISEQLQAAVDLLVHQQRTADGRRRTVDISITEKKAAGKGDGGPRVRRVFWWEPRREGDGVFCVRAVTQPPSEILLKFRQSGVPVPEWLEDCGDLTGVNGS